MPTPLTTTASQQAFHGLKWPVIIIALLVGHVVLMMFGLVAALTIPAAIEPSERHYEAAASSLDKQSIAVLSAEAMATQEQAQ